MKYEVKSKNEIAKREALLRCCMHRRSFLLFTSYLILFYIVLSGSARAQPVVSYITPDAGAPGMCVAVEMVAPVGDNGSFGPDQIYSPDIIVRLVRASDRQMVRLGPTVVSWNGRLIQQMVMIERSVPSLDTSIQLEVIYNGTSAPVNFRIIAPTHLGIVSGGGVIGQAPLVPRTARNTMIVDSMILKNGLFTCPQNDPDLAAAGSQAYLPIRILSMGPIRFINATLNANGQGGVTGSGGGSGGVGGGGGGSGYPGSGGAGYTGGGGEGAGNGGAGTGSFTGTNTYDGGIGLNGVLGGYGDAGAGGSDEGGGGGTGHPFGTSGASGKGNAPSAAGGYGGGSGGGDAGSSPNADSYGGGGGGNATVGGTGASSGDNSGHAVGNSMLIPLTGGSGGGSGNVEHFSAGVDGGSGGGGGGAIELTSFASFTDTTGGINAPGGAGSNGVTGFLQTAGGGGGGSGGSIEISARDSIDIGSSGSAPTFLIIGGAGGTGSANSAGGNGGLGRVRLNGFVSKLNGNTSPGNFFQSAKDYTGPSIQKVVFATDSFTVTGYAEYWDALPASPIPLNIFYEWTTGAWQGAAGIISRDAASHTAKWTVTLPISKTPADTEVYIVALQNENLVTGTYQDVPSGVMSHTSGIIQKVVRPQVVINPLAIDFGKVRVGSCSNDTTVQVRSTGDAPLDIDSIVVSGTDAKDFTLKTFGPIVVLAGDSVAVKLAFCPDSLKCPMSATLRIYTNAGYKDITLTGCAIQPQAVIRPMILDFGYVRIGECKDSTVKLYNIGTDNFTVTSETTGNARFTILDVLPITLAPGDSVLLHIRFCPDTTLFADTTRIASFDSVAFGTSLSPIKVTLLGGGKRGILAVSGLSDLDFGNVRLGTCKDSGFYVSNVGNDSLVLTSDNPITNGFQNGNAGFLYIAPALPITLAPHDSIFLQLRFCSTDTGIEVGQNSLVTDWGTGAGIGLHAHTGYGILATYTTIDFGDVIVGSCRDTLVPFDNIGSDTLVITGIPNLPAVFTVVTPLPVRIAPGEVKFITLQYCPSDTTRTTASSHVTVDTPSLGSPITLTGKGIQGALTASGPVDFGCITVGMSVTHTIVLTNTGTATISGITAQIGPSLDFSIVQNPAPTLLPGASDSVVVSVGSAQLGDVSSVVTITWTNGSPITIPITARVSLPPKITVLDTAVDFGTVNLGDSSAVQCIRITNYSCEAVDASHLSIGESISETFEIVSNNVPATLSDSAIATVCIRFIPKQNGAMTGSLRIANGPDTITGSILTGLGNSNAVGVELEVDTVAGVPGETVNVPVHTLNDITSAGITTVVFRVQFDPMQLDLKPAIAPIVSSIARGDGVLANPTYTMKKYSLGDWEITANFPSALSGKPVIAELPLEILLPTANTARIHLLSASFGTSPATLSLAADGEIVIQQCDTTDRAQIIPQAIQVSQNTPNPFNPRTSITLNVIRAGHVKIEVYNALGEIVMSPMDENVAAGERVVELDASALPSGAYRYVTQWTGNGPAVRDEKTMIVVK
jgi:hypothetical protein